MCQHEYPPLYLQCKFGIQNSGIQSLESGIVWVGLSWIPSHGASNFWQIGSLSSDDGDGNENSKKAILGLDWQNNNFGTCVMFFCTFRSRRCATTTRKCLISRFVLISRREHKTTAVSFSSFSPRTLTQSFRIQLPRNLPIFDELYFTWPELIYLRVGYVFESRSSEEMI